MLDLHLLMLPGQPGLDRLVVLREGWPDVPVVVLSDYDDSRSVALALDAGAMGFVSKSMKPSLLGQALTTVLAGGIFVPEWPGNAVGIEEIPELTPRQSEVLALLLQGLPNKRIEQALNLAPPTVKAHVSSVLRALGVTTRTQAVIAAHRLNLRWRSGG